MTPSTFLLKSRKRPTGNAWGSIYHYEWIKQAVTYTGKASIRQQRLPAEQVVWLVIALALYRHQSIGEVVDDLDLALPDAQVSFVSKSAVAQAWQRARSAPLKAFAISARAWADQDSKQFAFKGLNLLAMDGTTRKTTDTAEHREQFRAQIYPSKPRIELSASTRRHADRGSDTFDPQCCVWTVLRGRNGLCQKAAFVDP